MKSVRSHAAAKKRKAKNTIHQKPKVRKTIFMDNMALARNEEEGEEEEEEEEEAVSSDGEV